MFVGWGNYFFLVGSAAAALIGLMFIVVTLTAGRDRSELEPGKKLYTSPIVWHLGVVLLVSGGALAPDLPPRWFAALSAVIAAGGAIYSIRVAVGIVRAQLAENYSGFDMWWYGIAPAIAYCALGVSAAYLMNGRTAAVGGSAGSIMALLLISIHNEWDLVTFLAPEATTGSQPGGE